MDEQPKCDHILLLPGHMIDISIFLPYLLAAVTSAPTLSRRLRHFSVNRSERR
jgi:hypothetical protein